MYMTWQTETLQVLLKLVISDLKDGRLSQIIVVVSPINRWLLKGRELSLAGDRIDVAEGRSEKSQE